MKPKGQFAISEFRNPSGTISFRVTGTKIDGTRVKKSYSGNNAEGLAKSEKNALELEALNANNGERLRSTSLTTDKLRLAEVAFSRLDHEQDILLAIDYWNEHGKQRRVEKAVLLSKAVEDFEAWLDTTKELRDHSKRNLKTRINLFATDIQHLHLADITEDHVVTYLKGRAKLSAVTRDNDKRAVSRFFTWCIESKWLKSNPCSTVTVSKSKDKPPPAIFPLEDCEKLMRAAEKYKEGRCVRGIALGLFGKLRPFEILRLDPKQINLADNEIRLEKWQTKTGKARVVTIDPTLRAWLKAFPGKVYPDNWRNDFGEVRLMAGYNSGKPNTKPEGLKPWIDDGLRHTGISHCFRKTGSYGETAEQCGNTEKIIKDHYQSRTTTEETKKFYRILPKARRKSKKIIDLPAQSDSKNPQKAASSG